MADHFAAMVPQADAGQSKDSTLYGAIISVTILATIAVILRFMARRKSEASISYDDYSIVIALLFLYALNIGALVGVDRWGLGKHLSSLSKDQLRNFQKFGLTNFALYFTTTAAIKISLLLLYYRLFSPSRRFRIAIYATAIIVVAWWIAVVIADVFQCVPVNAFWDMEARNQKTASCMNTVTFSIGTGVSNLITDIMVLSLPIPMVWTLKTNRTQKMTLTGVFLLGFFVCATSIARTVKLVSPGNFDFTYSLTTVFIWTSVEPSAGIVSACLPIMRPLFGGWLSAVPSRSKSSKELSAKKTTSSSLPASASVASPVKDGFTRLDGPTYRDRLETSHPEEESSEASSYQNDGVGASSHGRPVASGSYGDKKGTSWLMFAPGTRDARNSRSGEERDVEQGLQMREWPRRRESCDWEIYP